MAPSAMSVRRDSPRHMTVLLAFGVGDTDTAARGTDCMGAAIGRENSYVVSAFTIDRCPGEVTAIVSFPAVPMMAPDEFGRKDPLVEL
jgi:hypothetical protein